MEKVFVEAIVPVLNQLKPGWVVVGLCLIGIYKSVVTGERIFSAQYNRNKDQLDELAKFDDGKFKNVAFAEQMNIRYKVNFSYEKWEGCLNAKEYLNAIKAVKRFYNIIEVEDGRLKPTWVVNPYNKKIKIIWCLSTIVFTIFLLWYMIASFRNLNTIEGELLRLGSKAFLSVYFVCASIYWVYAVSIVLDTRDFFKTESNTC